jgi:hypothetical protein
MTDEHPSTTVALLPPSLVPVPPLAETTREEKIGAVATQLQKTAGSPDFTGATVMIRLGPEWVDRVNEMLGRAGSAGEQLALALATNRDARRWTHPDSAGKDPRWATMAVRAQAEMTAMWTLGAAHGLANALIRLLLLNSDARKVIVDGFPTAKGFPPYSEDPSAWKSFDPGVLRVARKAAAMSPSPAAVTAAAALSSLFGDNRWDQFLDLRNIGFHRWRPQSVDGGTPKASALSMDGDETYLTVGTGPSNIAPNTETVLKVAEDGLDLFSAAAEVFVGNLYKAINELTRRTVFSV